jgi:hypothetical protein
MKLTNLEYVQSILSSLGSDEVNSVSDTTESLQVLNILKTVYFNIISRTLPPEHKQLIQLDPSLDPDAPTLMYVPDGIKSIEWIKYYDSNTLPGEEGQNGFEHDLNVDLSSGNSEATPAPGYQYVTIIPVRQFLDITAAFNPENDDVGTFTFTSNLNDFPGTYTFYFKNNKTPQFCTILSNYYVIFDSYDDTQDSTLQSSKTMAYGLVTPHWSNTDSFIPNVDEEQVPLLLNEAKSLAFFELKQQVHTKAEQEAKRQWSAVQRDKAKIVSPGYFDQLPDFGRRGMQPSRTFKDRGWDKY